MKQTMLRRDLWRAVRSEQERHQRMGDEARSAGKPVPDKGVRFFIEAQGPDGERYSAEVVKTLVCYEHTDRSVHGRFAENVSVTRHTSRTIPGGFKLQTLGGGVNFDMQGRGEAIAYRDGERVQVPLQIPNSVSVIMTNMEPADATKMNFQTLGSLLQIAAKKDPVLAQRLNEVIEEHRDLI